MVNVQHEDILLDKFYTLSKGNPQVSHIHIEKNKKSEHMDCEFIFDNEYIRLEAKTFKDCRNSSQNFIKILGSILKGRNLPLANTNHNYPIYYGLMIDYNDLTKFLKYKNTISKNDWDKVEHTYNAKYIVVIKKDEILLYDWDTTNFD